MQPICLKNAYVDMYETALSKQYFEVNGIDFVARHETTAIGVAAMALDVNDPIVAA